MTRKPPHSVKYEWARTEQDKGTTSMGTPEVHLSQVGMVEEQRDLLHTVMDSVGLPTYSERQDGTPSDVEPIITPPGRKITS